MLCICKKTGLAGFGKATEKIFLGLFSILGIIQNTVANYRSGTVNTNTVNSKFHLIRSYCEYSARILSLHVKNAWLIRTRLIRSSTNSK